jgi:hypothetical protein
MIVKALARAHVRKFRKRSRVLCPTPARRGYQVWAEVAA